MTRAEKALAVVVLVASALLGAVEHHQATSRCGAHPTDSCAYRGTVR